MKDLLRGLLYRICSYWVSAQYMPLDLAAGVYPALPRSNDPKRKKLPVGLAPFTPVANLISLPDPLLEQILQLLPTKDRLSHIPLVCTHTAILSSQAGAVWDEVVIDAEVASVPLKLNLLESWLSTRGAGVKKLKFESLKIWSEDSDDRGISPRTSGILLKVFTLCKVSLQSLTITNCDSIFAEADFAALAELSLIQKLHIQTNVQVRPQAISQLSSLTLLNSLSLTVDPGDRLNMLNINSHSGFPHVVVSLTALTSLTLSGWTCIRDLPETIGMLTALHELLLPNCVVTRLPASLQKLTDLERVDFCSNALGRRDVADLPTSLINAHKLTSVRLSGNFYSTVPTYLSSVTALQSLHIANNAIGSGCTSCLSHLTALTKLVMQQCNLTAVPQSLAALSRLKWLCLSRNRLESVPEGLPWQHLELLHLRGNALKCVPCDALSKAVQLVTVDCGDNLPLQVDHYLVIWGLIKQLPRLQHLFIDKITKDDEDNDLLSWSKASLQQIASLKKIMKKRKRRVCLYKA